MNMLLPTSNLGEKYYTLEKEYIFQKVPGESSMDAYTLTYVNRQPMGICCMTQGMQTGAL